MNKVDGHNWGINLFIDKTKYLKMVQGFARSNVSRRSQDYMYTLFDIRRILQQQAMVQMNEAFVL